MWPLGGKDVDWKRLGCGRFDRRSFAHIYVWVCLGVDKYRETQAGSVAVEFRPLEGVKMSQGDDLRSSQEIKPESTAHLSTPPHHTHDISSDAFRSAPSVSSRFYTPVWSAASVPDEAATCEARAQTHRAGSHANRAGFNFPVQVSGRHHHRAHSGVGPLGRKRAQDSGQHHPTPLPTPPPRNGSRQLSRLRQPSQRSRMSRSSIAYSGFSQTQQSPVFRDIDAKTGRFCGSVRRDTADCGTSTYSENRDDMLGYPSGRGVHSRNVSGNVSVVHDCVRLTTSGHGSCGVAGHNCAHGGGADGTGVAGWENAIPSHNGALHPHNHVPSEPQPTVRSGGSPASRQSQAGRCMHAVSKTTSARMLVRRGHPLMSHTATDLPRRPHTRPHVQTYQRPGPRHHSPQHHTTHATGRSRGRRLHEQRTTDDPRDGDASTTHDNDANNRSAPPQTMTADGFVRKYDGRAGKCASGDAVSWKALGTDDCGRRDPPRTGTYTPVRTLARAPTQEHPSTTQRLPHCTEPSHSQAALLEVRGLNVHVPQTRMQRWVQRAKACCFGRPALPRATTTSPGDSPSGIHVLKDVNLRVRQGAMTCILGTSGAGKSTLLSVLTRRDCAGALHYQGSVRYRQRELTSPGDWGRLVEEVGFVPQYGVVSAYLTVYENVKFVGDMLGNNSGVLVPVTVPNISDTGSSQMKDRDITHTQTGVASVRDRNGRGGTGVDAGCGASIHGGGMCAGGDCKGCTSTPHDTPPSAHSSTPTHSVSQVDSNVARILARLDLLQCMHSVVGGAGTGHRGVSGGERRRTAIASVLVAKPQMLVLDEPTTGLDAQTAHRTVRLLRDMVHPGDSSVWRDNGGVNGHHASGASDARSCHGDAAILDERGSYGADGGMGNSGGNGSYGADGGDSIISGGSGGSGSVGGVGGAEHAVLCPWRADQRSHNTSTHTGHPAVLGVLCTLHQPSEDTFALFDDVILMHAGRVYYCGSVEGSLQYFARAGMPCPPDVNPAEHMLSVLHSAASDGNHVRSLGRNGGVRGGANGGGGGLSVFATGTPHTRHAHDSNAWQESRLVPYTHPTTVTSTADRTHLSMESKVSGYDNHVPDDHRLCQCGCAGLQHLWLHRLSSVAGLRRRLRSHTPDGTLIHHSTDSHAHVHGNVMQPTPSMHDYKRDCIPYAPEQRGTHDLHYCTHSENHNTEQRANSLDCNVVCNVNDIHGCNPSGAYDDLRNIQSSKCMAVRSSHLVDQRFIHSSRPFNQPHPADNVLATSADSQHPPGPSQNPPGPGRQIMLLTGRILRTYQRMPLFLVGKLVQLLALSGLIAACFFDMGHNQTAVNNRLGSLYFTVIAVMFGNALGVVVSFADERKLFISEQMARLYPSFTYFCAKLLADLPIIVACSVTFSTIVYFSTGLQLVGYKFIRYQVILLLVSLCGQGIGLLVGACVRSTALAVIASPLCIAPFIMFTSYAIESKDIPAIYRPLQWLSPFWWGFNALAINEFDLLKLFCEPNELTTVLPGVSTCRYVDGSEVLAMYDIEVDSLPTDLIMLAVLVVFVRICAGVAMRMVGRVQPAVRMRV